MVGTSIVSQWRALACLVALAALSAGRLQAQDRGDRGLQPVSVEERRALLIGNANYIHSHNRVLVNTISDVRELEGVLREVGFDAV